MEGVMKSVRDNIFSVVSVNKTVKSYFEDENIHVDDLRVLLTLVINRVDLPTNQDHTASESESSDSVFGLKMCKAQHLIQSALMAKAAKEDNLSNFKELDANLAKIVSLAESKVFIRIQEDLYNFRSTILQGDTKVLENHNLVNAYFNFSREVKKALKEIPSFKELNSYEKTLLETEYSKDITFAVLLRLFSMYCEKEMLEKIEHNKAVSSGYLTDYGSDKEEELSKDVSSECCSGGKKNDCTKDKLIWLGIGVVIGILVYHYLRF